MPVDVVMPKLGLTMASGTIARWIKQPGDAVREGEPLLEVSTDKISYEVEAPATGTLAELLGSDGDEFACGAVIGTIALVRDRDAPAPAATAPRARGARACRSAPRRTSSTRRPHVVEAPRISAAGNGVAPTVRPSSTARAREGPHASSPRPPRGGWRANAASRSRACAAPVRAAASRWPTFPAPFDKLTLSRRGRAALPAERRAIYRKMTDVGVLPIPQVEHVARVDAVRALIERCGDFGWTAFAVYAVARLLRAHPAIRTDATTGAPFERIDIGIAADTAHGLIVPVVRNADARPLADVQREIVRLSALARDGALTAADIGGASFSISNVGPQGIERVAPLPDPPQTAILGIGAATQRAAVIDGAVRAAWMLTCVLAFDHRFIDGAPAARFLAEVVRALEHPGVFL